MKRKQDQWLYDAFAREVSIPKSMEARLAESLARVRRKCRGRDTDMKHYRRKGWKTALLIAAVVALLAGTAVAAGMHTGFFESAYEGAGERAVIEEPKYDAHGNQTGIYTYPAVGGFEVDEETTERLLGEYATHVGQSVQLEGYTITLQEIVLDENGIGTMMVDIENSFGLGELYSFASGGYATPVNYGLWLDDDTDFLGFGEKYLTIDSMVTDTSIRYVSYLTPYFELDPEGTLIFHVSNVSDDGVMSENELRLPVPETVPAKKFTGDGVEGELSAVGLKLIWERPTGYVSEDRITFGENDTGDVFVDGEYYGNVYMGLVWEDLAGPSGPPDPDEKFSIGYKDGSEYILKEEELLNVRQSSESDWTVWYAFNNIVDVEEVESICFDDIVLTPVE